jgi:hypothetical protein
MSLAATEIAEYKRQVDEADVFAVSYSSVHRPRFSSAMVKRLTQGDYAQGAPGREGTEA